MKESIIAFVVWLLVTSPVWLLADKFDSVMLALWVANAVSVACLTRILSGWEMKAFDENEDQY